MLRKFLNLFSTPKQQEKTYTLKPDWWIIEKAEKGMIVPFFRELCEERVISYGLSSYGYDIRLSSNDFRIFKNIPGKIVDPKDPNPRMLETATLHKDETGSYFILPGNSYGLGVAIEKLNVLPNILVICLGKSTYARAGVIANITPAENGWQGHLTLEFSNSSNADVKLYADEGIAQLIFLEGEKPLLTYADRKSGGKYQNQTEEVTLGRCL